jgi:hypothetical protein
MLKKEYFKNRNITLKHKNYDNVKFITTEYEGLFDSMFGLKGEGTTGYSEPLVMNLVFGNLKTFERRPKIIFVFRNPVKRIESSLMQRLKRKKILNFQNFLLSKLSFYSWCMYGLVVSKYIEAFGK